MCVPERVTFKFCTTVYKCLHGMGPIYLSEMYRPISSVAGRRHLRSADRGQQLVVPRYSHTTAGRRAFSCAGPSAWNSVPEYLKCFLFAMYWHSASSALEINLLMIARYISVHLIILMMIMMMMMIMSMRTPLVRSIPPSRPNKAGFDICPYVRPSVRPQKVSPIRTKVEVDEWCTTVCRMARSKVKVTGRWKLEILPFSKSISSTIFSGNCLLILKLEENI